MDSALGVVARVASFVVGFSLLLALRSTIRTVVLPRSANDALPRLIFTWARKVFDLAVSPMRSYERRDQVMAYFAPVALLLLPIIWLAVILVAYIGMFWALLPSSEGLAQSAGEALALSASSLLTLGFAPLHALPITLLAYTEAALGLILIALFIGYLPTMYSAWSRREAAVTLLEVRAGSPPSAVELLLRYHRIGRDSDLARFFATWEQWFGDVEETHTSLAALAFFRSPRSQRCWVTAAGTVLDAAALYNAALARPDDPGAITDPSLCLRAGYQMFQHLLELYFIPFNAHPTQEDAISLTRAEFDAALDQLAGAGMALAPDRHQAWRDFVGWRVNYDRPLLVMARLVMAPTAPWTSDRPPLPWTTPSKHQLSRYAR